MTDGTTIASAPTRRMSLLGILLFCGQSVAIIAAPPTPEPRIDFTTEIAPLFDQHCNRCHGAKEQKSRLRLDATEHLVRGGDSGEPLLIPGNSQESLLIQAVAGTHEELRMPPKGPRLQLAEIQRLSRWIDQGAPLPDQDFTKPRQLAVDHWSFIPPKATPVPTTEPNTASNPIDAFIHRALKTQGLTASPQTDRTTLIRRLYLLLHGLPPAPEDVASFLTDDHPTAYQRLVDKVLASPRFGERWARHWLDVVRFADTNGFETNRERKTAYHYRDYVIDAFNHNKPYNQFILDQLAGDSTGTEIATGFLVAGPYDIVKSPDINLTLAQRQDELADIVNTTGTAFLGLTLGCARCHNHKFDPILQKDYYAIQAVFAGVHHGEKVLPTRITSQSLHRLQQLKRQRSEANRALARLLRLAQNQATKNRTNSLRSAVNSRRNEELFAVRTVRYLRLTIHATNNQAQPCIDELEVYNPKGQNIALASMGTNVDASGSLAGFAIHRLEHINDGQLGNDRSWISDSAGSGWITLGFSSPVEIDRIVWGRDRTGQFTDRLATEYIFESSLDGQHWEAITSATDRRAYDGQSDPLDFLKNLSEANAIEARRLLAQETALGRTINELGNGTKVWAANFRSPPPTHRLYRGEPTQKREQVRPDTLTFMGTLGMREDEPEAQRRLKFARWVGSKDNPLTARVMVNRVWHYLFGQGLVTTTSDFGHNGIAPSHPELLDWLARRFTESDWSLKHVLRPILLSDTFRQSSAPRAEALERDASATYLWRFPPRRLEAEAIRDSILSVSGHLDLRLGGPGFYLHDVEVENVMHYFPKKSFGPAEFRRMVYLFKIRQEQDAVFGAFDCPDGNQAIPRRSRSNTPLQALNLFNSPFSWQQAKLFGQRLAKEHAHVDAQIERAYALLYGRAPDEFERKASRAMIESEGLPAFCRALFNTSEFLFVF